jgi:3',5'-cyclic AMP phosphodiesterase CpdA
MSVVLQISDPHFGTEQPPVVEALVRLAHAQAPRLLVLSGDITQRARPGQFRAARQFVDRLRIPSLLAIPGNHDIPLWNVAARLFMPYARYRREFGDDLEPVHSSDNLLVIGVKTTRRFRHVDGTVSMDQIERVARLLEADRGDRLRIVVTHQPACVVMDEDAENLLHRHEAAVRRWASAGADIVMGGHIHRPYVCAQHERHAGLQGRMWVVQAGTATSSRVRFDAGNSVNVLRYHNQNEPRCTVERWDFVPAAQNFVQAEVRELVLAPRRSG